MTDREIRRIHKKLVRMYTSVERELNGWTDTQARAEQERKRLQALREQLRKLLATVDDSYKTDAEKQPDEASIQSAFPLIRPGAKPTS